MPKDKHDFAGWVTKNDIMCADGVVIKHDAFKDNDQKQVPLVWNHNHSAPTNVLGHVLLQNEDIGVYGFGYFNDSEEALHAKELIKHGDISAMSIGANKIQKKGRDVVHGKIYEVSLVLAGANPGALIETVMSHSEEPTDNAIIYTGTLLHSADDVINHKEGATAMPTIGEILDTLSEEQMNAVEALLANVLEQSDTDEEEEQQEELQQNDEGGEADMKHNVFNGPATPNKDTELKHVDIEAVFADAKKSTLKEAMLQHSITNIEVLFPDAKVVSGAPFIYKDRNTAGAAIVNACHKSPFSNVKTIIADLTPETARAKGYITGAEKFEQVFELLTRSTTPQTIYKKQALDRDDVIDIVDYDVISFINAEMKMMLIEEIGRALMVGDGRDVASADKIKPANIRPIITDDVLYCHKVDIDTPLAVIDVTVIEGIILAMGAYEGSGSPTLYCHPNTIAKMRLLRAEDGHFLFGDIPSKEAIALRLGVSAIQESTFFAEGTFLIVNLGDYTLGATKGGEVTNFEDFDIDFNKHKYLIETRLSGALTIPKSAVYITVTASA